MYKFSVLLISILFLGYSSKAQICQIDFDEVDGMSIVKDNKSGVTFDVRNNLNRPERINGIKGNALRLDGWSTWATNITPTIFPKKANKLTIETWYATESFTAQRGGLVSFEDKTNGFGIEIGPTGTIYAYFYINNEKQEVYSLVPIKKYEWNLIAVTLDSENGEIILYLNGNKVGEKLLSTKNQFVNFVTDACYIGRSNTLKYFDIFPLNVLNGAIDELSITESIKNESYFSTTYRDFWKPVDLTINPKKRFEGDYLRPIYHSMPNAVWTNESYALFYYNKKYHMFFQKNPNGPYLYFMHWGHLTSDDLVNWQEEKIALAPGASLESFGIWSGCSIMEKNGEPRLFYTAVNGNWASIHTATTSDSTLIDWKKSESNPVIERAPTVYPNMDFRDPYIFEASGNYYLIIGSGKSNNKGGMLITYRSSDLKNWTLIDPIFEHSDYGIFWEMPSMVKFDDSNYMLAVTPIPTSTSPAKTIYWIGNFKNEKFIPFSKEPSNLELINGNLLSPAFGADKNKKNVFLGIIPEERDVTAQIKSGWRNVFSIPRTVRLLKDSTIGQIPHENLCSLRKNLTIIQPKTIEINKSNNINVKGTHLELNLNIQADSGSVFSVVVFKNASIGEKTKLNVDLQNNTIELDRSESSVLYPIKKNQISEYIMNYKDKIQLQIFLDGSIMEVFVDQLLAFSCRVYPSSPESNLVDIIANKGSIKLLDSKAWELMSMKENLSSIYCELTDSQLPSQLRKKINKQLVLGMNELNNDLFKLYPNPVQNNLNFSSSCTEPFRLSGFNSLGVEFDCTKLQQEGMMDFSRFQTGVYFILIQTSSALRLFKIIVK